MSYVGWGGYIQRMEDFVAQFLIVKRDSLYYVIQSADKTVIYITSDLTDAKNYAVSKLPNGNGIIVVRTDTEAYIEFYQSSTRVLSLHSDGKIKTQNLLVKEHNSSELTIRNIDDSAYRSLRLSYLRVKDYIIAEDTWITLDSYPSADAYIVIRSHDGSAYVDNLIAVGGIVKINNGLLYSNLDANSYKIVNLGEPTADNDSARLLDVKTLAGLTQHDETANRALNTEYQNTTGKVMFVTVVIKFSGATSTDLCEVNGFVYPTAGSAEFVAKQSAYYGNTTYDLYVTLTLVVPPGYYYKIDAVPRGGSTASIYKWHEYY